RSPTAYRRTCRSTYRRSDRRSRHPVSGDLHRHEWLAWNTPPGGAKAALVGSCASTPQMEGAVNRRNKKPRLASTGRSRLTSIELNYRSDRTNVILDNGTLAVEAASGRKSHVPSILSSRIRRDKRPTCDSSGTLVVFP